MFKARLEDGWLYDPPSERAFAFQNLERTPASSAIVSRISSRPVMFLQMTGIMIPILFSALLQPT
jgi:hypothetical protein